MDADGGDAGGGAAHDVRAPPQPAAPSGSHSGLSGLDLPNDSDERSDGGAGAPADAAARSHAAPCGSAGGAASGGAARAPPGGGSSHLLHSDEPSRSGAGGGGGSGGACGSGAARLSDAALQQLVGKLRVTDFSVTDAHGALQPLDARVPLHISGCCARLPSGRFSQVKIGEWRVLGGAGGAESGTVLAMGCVKRRWYTLASPDVAYAPLWAALQQRLLAGEAGGTGAAVEAATAAERLPSEAYDDDDADALALPPSAPDSPAAELPPSEHLSGDADDDAIALPPSEPGSPAAALDELPPSEEEDADEDALPPSEPGSPAAPRAADDVAGGAAADSSDDDDDDDGAARPLPAALAHIDALAPPQPADSGMDALDELHSEGGSSDGDDADVAGVPALPPALANLEARACAAGAHPAHSDGGADSGMEALCGFDDADAAGADAASDDDDDSLGLRSEDDAPPPAPPADVAAASDDEWDLLSEEGGGTETQPLPDPAAAAGAADAADTAGTSHPAAPPGGGGGDAAMPDADGDGTDEADDVADDAAAAAAALAERWQANDTQCGVCDDGGDVLLCEGACMRAFHHLCLGMKDAEYTAIVNSPLPWQCPSCETGRHRCFFCLAEGTTSDADAAAAAREAARAKGDALPELRRVHKCSVFECPCFYHPACAAAAAAGAPPPGRNQPPPAPPPPGEPQPPTAFSCPQHVCAACGGRSDPALPDRRRIVVPCRRCPTAYHIGCMPADVEGATPRRLWLNAKDSGNEHAEVDSSLIYCMRHEIPEGKGSPLHVQPVFSEAVLHAAARAIASRTGVATRCLCCKKTVLPPHKRAAPGDDVAVASGGGAGGAAAATSSRAAALQRVAAALARARAAAPSFASHDAALARFDTCYSGRCARTVGPDRLAEMEATVAESLAARRRGDVALADALLSGPLLLELRNSHLALRVANSPWLYRSRYTSYGRHFTVRPVLAAVAARLALLLRHGDTLVDSSAGANDWLPLMARRAAAARLRGLTFHAFDLFPAADAFGFREKNWFDVRRADLGNAPGDRLVIGLNPPFGVDNALAERFAVHAASFQPRLIALIVPRATRMPPGYVELERNVTLCAGRAFYLPGSHDAEAGGGQVQDWNKEAPAFIVLQRADTLGGGGAWGAGGAAAAAAALFDPTGAAWVAR